jgi:hypothetical protein
VDDESEKLNLLKGEKKEFKSRHKPEKRVKNYFYIFVDEDINRATLMNTQMCLNTHKIGTKNFCQILAE